MEFKKLSDVEVIAEPTETANVLIEENGVIKKAPKTTVGGKGLSPIDVVIMCYPNFDIAELVYGDYNSLLEKYNNKQAILALIYQNLAIEGEENIYSSGTSIINKGYTVYIGIYEFDENAICLDWGGSYVYIRPDNTVGYTSYD